jgi:hypothetical protein
MRCAEAQISLGAPITAPHMSMSTSIHTCRTVPPSWPLPSLRVFVFSLLAVCGGDSGSNPAGPPPVPSVRSVEISPRTVSLVALDDTARLNVVAKDSLGRPVASASIAWRSSNASVISVAGGVIRSTANGSAFAIASSGTATDSIAVIVAQVPARITFASIDSLFELGDSTRVQGTVADRNGRAIAQAPAIQWSTADPTVASVVSGSGLVHARGAGTARIIARAGAAVDTARVRVWASVAPAVVDASTLDGKVMFGYQGWFNCNNEGIRINPWRHWFGNSGNSTPTAERLSVDFWPDISELTPTEQCATALMLPDGSAARVYSNYNRTTTMRHFKWMKDYGIDGAWLQRFPSELKFPDHDLLRDRVHEHSRDGAEAHGRVFGVMYDVTGITDAEIVPAITRDWPHIVNDLRLTASSRYIRHKGLPVVSLWGFGFGSHPATPQTVAALIDFFHNNPNPAYRAIVIGGVPTYWRTLDRDSRSDPAWAQTYRSFDIISPWSVGRFRTQAEADAYYTTTVIPDIAATKAAGREYLPVLWPGFSWYNQKQGADPLNQVPRAGGAFYWRQVFDAMNAGATMLYVAMFDEMDEGTAMFKLAPTPAQLPTGVKLLPLNADGINLPSDWYLRLGGMSTKTLRREIPNRDKMPIHP